MSDSSFPASIPCDWQGGRYVLAVLTHLEEGLFVSEHEGFALSRIEATRGKIGEQAYQRALLGVLDMQAGGAFSYGSNLSLRWLFSPEGRAAYIAILMRKGEAESKGQAPPPEHVLARAIRKKDEVLEAVFERVLKRDFFEWWQSVQPPGNDKPEAGSSAASAASGTTSQTSAA